MTSPSRRNRNLIIFTATVALGFALAFIESQRTSANRPRLVDNASIGAPVAPPARPRLTQSTAPKAPPPALISAADTPQASPDIAAPTTAPYDITNADDDLRSSQDRLNAVDKLTQTANRLFDMPDVPDDFGSWSRNPQDLDQLDYQTPEGAITAWYSPDDTGYHVRAQEAQLANGEVVDRWFSDDGKVEQVMHQFDRENSNSVYYYPSGEVEAMRVVRDGNELFTKYDRDGRQIQRTYTPANAK